MRTFGAVVLALAALLPGFPALSAQSPGGKDKERAGVKSDIGISYELTGPKAAQKGLVILKVMPRMAAEKAGLKRGDIITKVGDKKMDSYEAMKKLLNTHSPGEKLTFHILRDGRAREVPVTLGPPLPTVPPDRSKGVKDRTPRDR